MSTINGIKSAHVRYKNAVTPEELMRSAQAGAKLANRLVGDELHAPKSGTKWPWLPNKSSAAGEVPAAQFGELEKGLVIDNELSKKNIASVEFSSTAPYAHWLEYGNENIDARPYMRWVAVAHRDDLIDAMAAEVEV